MAVALVVAYHVAPAVVPGGFLGVDVFFVLSGFLITSLLLDEARAEASIDIATFYVRRLRRLAPALLLLLAAGALYAEVWAAPGEVGRLRDHSLWSLGYLANWRFIADGTTYTDLVVGQSPLRHTWSLAIEEQFYVVFPLVVVLIGWASRWSFPRWRRGVFVVAVVGALASAGWMAVRWSGVGNASRGYFGTDTRVHSLLVGVALGAVLLGRPPRQGASGRVAAASAAVGFVVMVVAVATSREASSGLQHGGFLIVALAMAGIISGIEGASWLRRGLSRRPLVALGVISYGVYLWHWPIIVVVNETRTGLSGVTLGLLQIALTLAVATLSYRLVERPVRHGALSRRLGRASWVMLPVGVVSVVALVVVATVATPSTDQSAAGDRFVPALDAPAPPIVPLPVEAVIFGDSVAHTIAGGTVGAFPVFNPWTPDQSPFDPHQVGLSSVAKPACAFLPGATLNVNLDGANLGAFCGDWRGDLRAALTARPGAVLIVALTNDASSRLIDGEVVALGSAAHTDLVAELLTELQVAAEANGGHLALVALPPRVGAAANALDVGGQREVAMRAELRAYGQAHPGVRVLDLFEQICPAANCDRPARGFDPRWRYDGLHFSRAGAGWVAQWITEQLTTVPVNPTVGG